MGHRVADLREHLQAVREARAAVGILARDLEDVLRPGRMVYGEEQHEPRPLGHGGDGVERLEAALLELAEDVDCGAQRDLDGQRTDGHRIGPAIAEPALIRRPGRTEQPVGEIEEEVRLALERAHARPEPRVHVAFQALHPQDDRRREVGVGAALRRGEEHLGGAQALRERFESARRQ